MKLAVLEPPVEVVLRRKRFRNALVMNMRKERHDGIAMTADDGVFFQIHADFVPKTRHACMQVAKTFSAEFGAM